MRAAILILMVMVLLASAGYALADQGRRFIGDIPSRAIAPATIRIGPGDRYPANGRLRPGEAVVVQSALGSWCSINSSDPQFVPCRVLRAPKGGWVVGKTIKKSCWPRCGD